jgi:hypothetical protein
MPGGPVRFHLDDGELLTLTEGELAEVYELLWKLAPKTGAISVAALIRGVTPTDILGAPVELNQSQTAAMRAAVSLLHAV